jgi:uncharacterized protein YlzI (FlbEa/FlbD family)
MSDSLLEKYAGRTRSVSLQGEPELLEADFGCFGWLRGVRDRSLMLELRKKDGHVMAIGYAWIERVELVPESGITLHVPGNKIRIEGSGLNSEVRSTVRLFDGIIRQRVPWIGESDRSHALQAGDEAVIVERIRWDQ